MILIYTPYPSERIKYVLNYLFGQRLDLDWLLVDNDKNIDEKFRIRINYSAESMDGFYQIVPEGLLNEKGINQKNIEVCENNGLQVIFKNEGQQGYDIFSAIFYCLSRYEEYVTLERDKHGRFKYTDSFLWKNNCLNMPLVDIWVDDFKKKLVSECGLNLNDFRQEVFSVLPTIDIDAAFTYKGRSPVRQLAGFAKSLLEFNFKEVIKRFKVTVIGAEDPNDNFIYQYQQLAKWQSKANYFIQIGDYGPLDKNIPASNKEFRDIIKAVAKNGHIIGLHPSYQSDSNFDIIKKEKETLEHIIGESVINSRQHFLRFSLPKTYRVLLDLGFKKEFSMGYSEVTGFRAGTSKSFFWYDLEMEEETALEIMPFCVMDVAYKQFAKVSADTAIEQSNSIRRAIEQVKGVFCFVYHNESLSNHRGWEGWKEVFEAWLKK